MSKWKGTPVPNSGLVEKVYLNTSLSTEEVVAEMDKVTYDSDDSYSIATDISTVALGFAKFGDLYVILDGKKRAYYFACGENVEATLGFVGWNPDFNGVIDINVELVSEVGDFSIGTENDKLINLVSTTPFELVEEDPIDDVLKPFLKEVADAIRYVEGSSEDINAQDFNERIIALGKGGIPEEIATAEEMTALLVEANVGKVYKYTGETNETFTNECYYLIEEVAE